MPEAREKRRSDWCRPSQKRNFNHRQDDVTVILKFMQTPLTISATLDEAASYSHGAFRLHLFPDQVDLQERLYIEQSLYICIIPLCLFTVP